MNRGELERVARAMVADGKGILAADESSGTIKKRFDGIKLESTEEHRRTYREMLFTAPGAKDSISGVIFYDETLRQKTKDGVPFADYLDQARHHSRHQGGHGRQAAGRISQRDHHRRPRWPARTADRVLQARRALRQVARGHRHRRGHSHAIRHRGECACAGALRRALPGTEHRADRRARSADGWRALARALRGSDRCDAAGRVRSALRAPRASRRHGAQAEHGDLGQEGREAR